MAGEVLKRRSGLGRGLDALLPAEDTGLEARGPLEQAAIGAIGPNPRQPRRSFDEAGIEELAESVKQLGVLQPLLVRRSTSGRYELIAGERRLRAAKSAGLDRVPVIVVDTDERGSLERALVENIHRTDLDPVEEAAAFKQLMEEGGLTHEALARKVGKNRVTITNALRLLDLPTDIQRYLVERTLSAAHGRVLLGLQNNPMQVRLARRAAQDQLSVRETEELVRRYQSLTGAGPRRSTSERETSAVMQETQRRLSDHLQTRVRVDAGKRKGRIVIDFVSPEELERISDVITGRDGGAITQRVRPE
ncbi:MAG: ParB/RepB/Spo0J family partition protein [Actinobacteria bacterium]|nr:ParB/RepB/Spo0J family partition protein [Actinomycetota bacterium]